MISVLGDATLMNKQCISMVGARNASLNGRKFAQKLASELGTKNQVIVSGLARGIDTASHNGALETGTIAVVAGGIDVIYPEENTGLYEQIKECGLIIAENKLGQKPYAQSFPKRNRIVSGLSKGVIVVEATMRSGSLITARLAGEQGRDVFAVPGHPLDPRAAGTNYLLRDGATIVRNAHDVLESLNDFTDQTMRESAPANNDFHTILAPELSKNFAQDLAQDNDIPQNSQEIVLNNLSFTPVSVDELIRACHLSIPVLQIILLELELAERIKRTPGNKVSLTQEG